MGYDFYVRTKQDLIDAIEAFGVVPYFRNSIPGFSLEEHCAPQALWSDTGDGSWEWKGPVIRATGCAYGKLFEKKAAYVSRELYLDLANYRRDGYDFDARYEDGLASYRDRELFELADKQQPVLSKVLRLSGGYAYGRGEGKKGFDGIVTRLQEQCYLVVSDFVYSQDKYGRPSGWGVAQYSTPERFMGESFTERVYQREPKESYERLLEHLAALHPQVGVRELKRFLK